jgi:hypothetical protein
MSSPVRSARTPSSPTIPAATGIAAAREWLAEREAELLPVPYYHVVFTLPARIAISNRRLIACDQKGVTFKWKDYRLEGRERYKRMTLATDEFIRRFLMHVLPTLPLCPV